MEQKTIIISTLNYKEKYYQMNEQEKNEFNAKVAEVVTKFGLELLERYKSITRPNQVINIFSTNSIDTILTVRSELEKMSYFLYVDVDWNLAVKN